MRKICLALCLSLFTSLIHAVVMPIDISVAQSHHQTIVVDASAYHCDEAVNNSQDANSKQPCHGDSYQCCLGLVFTPPLAALLPLDFTENPVSEYPSLALQPMINFIYKPPKA